MDHPSNRLYVKYHQKMQDYIGKVTNAEQSHELYGKIALLEERISEAVSESKLLEILVGLHYYQTQ